MQRQATEQHEKGKCSVAAWLVTVMMMADKAFVSQHGMGHCLHTVTAAWQGWGWAPQQPGEGETWSRVFREGSLKDLGTGFTSPA